MPRRHAWLLGALAIALFAALNVLGGALLSPLRADLTEGDQYTLSEGARRIARSLSEPITLQLFYSREQGASLGFDVYAQRVRETLREFERAADGKIRFEEIDPEPYSDEEDLAVNAGVYAYEIGPGGQDLRFGLAARNAVGDTERIPFLAPDQERLFEYSVAELLVQLDRPERATVGVLSNLPLDGGPTFPGAEPARPWAILQQLRATFDVEVLSRELAEVPDDLDVLVLVHPQELSDATLRALDRHALAGGRILAFVDPHCLAQQADPFAGGGGEPDRASDLGPLLEAWGVEFDARRFVADRVLAEEGFTQSGGRVYLVRDPTQIVAGAAEVARDDPVVANLDRLRFATPGSLAPVEGGEFEFAPLVTTTTEASEFGTARLMFGSDPAALFREVTNVEEPFVLAARVRGRVATAFPPEAPEDGEAAEPAPEATGDLDLVVVADADLLADRAWLAGRTLGGQLQVDADNPYLVLNALDVLSGDTDLLSIRARDTADRPFTEVERRELAAKQRFEAEILALEAERDEIRREIAEIRRAEGGSTSLVPSEEEERRLDEFDRALLETNERLRDLQYAYRKDLDRLERNVLLVNYAAVPALVVLAGLGLWTVRRRRRAGA